VVDLATHAEAPEEESGDVRLDELVERVAERTRRRTDRTIEVSAQPVTVHGSETMLERAVGNLLDNAHKWSPNGRPIEVSVAGGRVAVRDHGPGVAREDKPRVFDRFYRSTAARSMPGSGLGLAIVRQIISNHGGRVFVTDAPGGGAVVGFEIPHKDS
jgi:two-component system sensor histidine kinase MprB